MSSHRDSGDKADPNPWRPWWRWIISGLLAFHVAAVFMGPFAFSTRTGNSASEFADWLLPVFRPYAQAAYLDHGYAFFAPNPGSSLLVKYKVEFADGRPAVEGTFPDLKRHRPRLLYHRHFMLSDQLHSSYALPKLDSAPEMPPSLNATQESAWKDSIATQEERRLRSWKVAREAYEARWKSFEEHLLHAYDGESVSMVRVEHRPPTPLEFGTLKFRLDDERLYRQLTKDDSGERPPEERGEPR